MTSGLCFDAVGQQVDIFAILLRRRAPISRDLLSQLWDSIKTTLKNFPSANRKILKSIPLTGAREPALVQEHKSYSCALWDDNVNYPFSEVRQDIKSILVEQIIFFAMDNFVLNCFAISHNGFIHRFAYAGEGSSAKSKKKKDT